MRNRWIQVLVVIIGLYMAWVSARGLWDLKKVGGRVDEAREELKTAKQENQALEKRLREVTSVDFLEKEAREKLNLQKPGEVVVVLEEDVALAPGGGQDELEVELENWEKWLRLFFD